MDEYWCQALVDNKRYAEYLGLGGNQNLHYVVAIFQGDSKTFYKDEVFHLLS